MSDEALACRVRLHVDRVQERQARALTRPPTQRKERTRYLATVRGDCVMGVWVEASSEEEARKLIEQEAYEPAGVWMPVYPDKVTVSQLIEVGPPPGPPSGPPDDREPKSQSPAAFRFAA